MRANRHAKKVEVTVFGWKVWVVWEPASKIPLALAIDGINEPDNKHALHVLKTAQENVAGHARIRSVALDRGFLDGKLLSAIEAESIQIPRQEHDGHHQGRPGDRASGRSPGGGSRTKS